MKQAPGDPSVKAKAWADCATGTPFLSIPDPGEAVREITDGI
jgi:hypothetical protein